MKWFALAIVLYWMLSGAVMFYGVMPLLDQFVNQPLEEISHELVSQR